jgi:ATP-dependent Zn protease
MQALVFTLIIGSLGRKVYVKHSHHGPASTGPPIELPYSSFLDLVDQAGSKKGGTTTSVVVVDNVRIGPDRIIYRLTKEATADSESKIMVAYSRKVAASPELIQHLRSNEIPFMAAPQPRTNSLAVVARTAMLAFYMLILFRMYKSFGGNKAGGSGDTPGKLASTSSSLPLASFNDIQGIDEAKLEVMELVDTLRNPEKYAILGARAPTGLLLDGPPGTGKVRNIRQSKQ